MTGRVYKNGKMKMNSHVTCEIELVNNKKFARQSASSCQWHWCCLTLSSLISVQDLIIVQVEHFFHYVQVKKTVEMGHLFSFVQLKKAGGGIFFFKKIKKCNMLIRYLRVTKLHLFRTYLYISHKIRKKFLNMNLKFKILILTTDKTHFILLFDFIRKC